jgi:hypothetical protein
VRFVAIIAGFAVAVAVLIVILWAAWYECYLFDFRRCSGNNVTGFVVLSQVQLTYPLS